MPNEAVPSTPRGLKLAGGVAAVIAIAVVAFGIINRSSDANAAQDWANRESVPTVQLVAVKPSVADDGMALPGTMQAWEGARIYARVGGYVKDWYKDIGAEVAAGTPLGSIDTPELDQQLEQARAALSSARARASLAKSTAARWNDLVTDNSVSRQEADEKNGDYAVKTAAVAEAQANLGRLLAQKAYATVRAPFAGIVTARNADIGDLVGPGATGNQPIFAVADVHRIRVYVSVPQNYSSAMRNGLDAKLTVPEWPDRVFKARVIGTSGAINPQTGTLQVQLVADNPGRVLKPGGYAQVTFAVPGQAGTVIIPASTLLFRSAGTQVAMVGPDNRVRLQSVTLGRDLGGTVEVTAGLATNARIVDNPPDSLATGETVHVAATHG